MSSTAGLLVLHLLAIAVGGEDGQDGAPHLGPEEREILLELSPLPAPPVARATGGLK